MADSTEPFEPIYVKPETQGKTLSYVLMLALIIYCVNERRTQALLTENEVPMEIVGALPSDKPTGRRGLERLQKVLVMSVDWERLVPEIVEPPERVLGLIELGRSVYGVRPD